MPRGNPGERCVVDGCASIAVVAVILCTPTLEQPRGVRLLAFDDDVAMPGRPDGAQRLGGVCGFDGQAIQSAIVYDRPIPYRVVQQLGKPDEIRLERMEES